MSLPLHSQSYPPTPHIPLFSKSKLYLAKYRLCSWRTLLPGVILLALCFLFINPAFLSYYGSDLNHWHSQPPPPSHHAHRPPMPPPAPPFRRPGKWTTEQNDTNPPADLANVWPGRAEQVKDAFKFAWNEYKEHAFPWDEVTPLKAGKVNKYVRGRALLFLHLHICLSFNGWGGKARSMVCDKVLWTQHV